jgi:hypothetical protein
MRKDAAVSAGRPARLASGTTRWWPILVAGGLCLGLAAACSAGSGPVLRHHAPAAHSATPARQPTASEPPSLQVTPAAYQLPSGISREVVLASGGHLLIIGGLDRRSVTTRVITELNPVTGRTVRAGRLAAASHDAAGALLGGTPYLFGGGVTASLASVQSLRGRGTATVAGQLPGPRSDLSSVTLGGTAYLVGGYDGASYDPAVLATGNGRTFRTVARLPVPVRYAAVAGTGRDIYVFGGQTASGASRVIQRVNLGTGRATVVGHLPAPVTGATAVTLGGQIFIAGGRAGTRPVPTRTVLAYNPARHAAFPAGTLPVPVSNAASAVIGGTAFVVGGSDGHRQVPTVAELRLVPGTAAVPGAVPPAAAPDAGVQADAVSKEGTGSAPWLLPATGEGHLRPHSNPAVLPADVLIADNHNNRLVVVDPQGRIRWRFPRPGDLGPGQHFRVPDDAFFSPNGRYIIGTEEDYSVISVISVARHKIVYRYGKPGVPGSAAGRVSNPDDAMMMPGGGMITADIKNCRILVLAPPGRQAHRPRRVIGTTGVCGHNPPREFSSPNGAFPATNGSYIVTEITGDWATQMSLRGRVAWSVHPPGVAYPSDTNEVYPGRYLTADYSPAGQVVEFNQRGRLLWRFRGLNQPSLALPLPNGDVLVNDDYHHRVIVIDPVTNKIVWQYGHTGVPGARAGYLNDPDGVDLVPPDSMLITHGPTMGQP